MEDRIQDLSDTIAIYSVDLSSNSNSSPTKANGYSSWTTVESPKLTYTYGDIGRYSTIIAHNLLTNPLIRFSSTNIKSPALKGLASDDSLKTSTVALFMDNSPEFIILLFTFIRLGCPIALVNTQLRSTALLHSFNSISANLIIVDTNLIPYIEEIHNQLPLDVIVLSMGKPEDNNSVTVHPQSHNFVNLSSIIESGLKQSRLPYVDFVAHRASKNINTSSILFYIYTSGTTGLPKAAKVKHNRFLLSALSFSTFFRLSKSDRFYVTLPLFHSVGGIISLSLTFYLGTSIILRKKFSASSFWHDCNKYEATTIFYIGQLCRYLYSQRPSQSDRSHRVMKAIGNGMPVEIWRDFRTRFNIPYIGEFYASTEGNCNLVNNRNKVGAIGYIPWIAELFYPISIVRFDIQQECPIRDDRNRLQVCSVDEIGELIGKISTDPMRAFEGYTHTLSTQQKILENGFGYGDRWFRTGDLVRRDKKGYIYFVDRIGDTFRWKGENCSTMEVSGALNKYKSSLGEVLECCVYGVSVLGYDGKCGMASIVWTDMKYLSSNIQSTPTPITTERFGLLIQTELWKDFYSYCMQALPSYMCPYFVRLVSDVATTSTFKQQKTALVAEGYNPSHINDPILFRYDQGRTFIPLDAHLYDKIIKGEIRL